jgi:hypothetical protein
MANCGVQRAIGTATERTAQVAGGNFTGLARSSVAGASYPLGANFTLGRIDVFDSTWLPASVTARTYQWGWRSPRPTGVLMQV